MHALRGGHWRLAEILSEHSRLERSELDEVNNYFILLISIHLLFNDRCIVCPMSGSFCISKDDAASSSQSSGSTKSASDDESDICWGHDLYKAALLGDEEYLQVILKEASVEEVNWTGEVCYVNMKSLMPIS